MPMTTMPAHQGGGLYAENESRVCSQLVKPSPRGGVLRKSGTCVAVQPAPVAQRAHSGRYERRDYSVIGDPEGFVQRIGDAGSVASGGFWSSEQLEHAFMSDVLPAMVIGIMRDIKKRA
jgi:hypothetical protein